MNIQVIYQNWATIIQVNWENITHNTKLYATGTYAKKQNSVILDTPLKHSEQYIQRN